VRAVFTMACSLCFFKRTRSPLSQTPRCVHTTLPHGALDHFSRDDQQPLDPRQTRAFARACCVEAVRTSHLMFFCFGLGCKLCSKRGLRFKLLTGRCSRKERAAARASSGRQTNTAEQSRVESVVQARFKHKTSQPQKTASVKTAHQVLQSDLPARRTTNITHITWQTQTGTTQSLQVRVEPARSRGNLRKHAWSCIRVNV